MQTTHVCNTKRVNSLIPFFFFFNRWASVYTQAFRNKHNIVCLGEGFDSSDMKRYILSLSFSLTLSLSFFFSFPPSFSHFRCLPPLSFFFSRTRPKRKRLCVMCYFSLIFMLIGLRIFVLPLSLGTLLKLIANINTGSEDILSRGTRRIPGKFIRLARTFRYIFIPLYLNSL